MSTKITISAIAAILTANVIAVPTSAMARAEHRLDRGVNQLNVKAVAGAFGAANTATRGQSALTVVSPRGVVLGSDPDRAVRFQLSRDWPGAAFGM